MEKMKFVGVTLVCVLVTVGVVRLKGAAQNSADLWVCPMHQDVVSNTPGTCPVCRMVLVNRAVNDMRPYDVVLATDPSEIKAGVPFTLKLTVRHPATGDIVSAFELAHEMWFHLFIISRDMTVFQHVHPQLQPDRSWAIDVVLPRQGAYVVLSDFVPAGGLPQFVSRSLETVDGTHDPSLAILLERSYSFQTSAGDIHATLRFDPERLVAGRPAQMTYTLTDGANGRPITDLQPYLGALGHTLIVHEGFSQYVHAHPAENDARLSLSRPRGGPDVTFDTLFAKPGRYRAWTQFQRNGQVHTVSFTFDVAAAQSGQTQEPPRRRGRELRSQ